MDFETTLKEIISRTYKAKSFRFQRPPSFNYKPGQFIHVTIKTDSKETSKYFSISSSPTEKEHIEFTKKLRESEFSKALNNLKIGDPAKIKGPYGAFTFENEHPKLGMLSGGIGITPLISICKYCTDTKLNTKITLICGNRTEKDIAFKEELEDMQRKNKNLKIVFTLDEPDENWKGHTGRVNAQMIKQEIPDYKERTFYTCGPPLMVEAMSRLLIQIRIPKNQIKKENFSGY